jgi:alkylhydroperoxidase/carboxymuconolactone decarboxylase family protein YurZ
MMCGFSPISHPFDAIWYACYSVSQFLGSPAGLGHRWAMGIALINPPSTILHRRNPEAGASYRIMREALLKGGPLDPTTCELIILASFATMGFKNSFKSHALRALMAGISKEAIEHAVLAILGATTARVTVTNALGWMAEADAVFRKAN